MGQPQPGGPDLTPVGRRARRNDRSSLAVLVAILAVLAVVGGALIVALVASDDDVVSPFAGETGGAPSLGIPSPGAAGSDPGQPTSPPAPDPSALPTDKGPSESDYVEVARTFVKAARAGNCARARQLTDDLFNTVIADANLCEGQTRRALRNDDLADYAINFFGSYGAAVQFDRGRTYVSLVAAADRPLVQVLIAY
jgi:hypothetical protein